MSDVRVYRVKNEVAGDYIARSWEEVCAFLANECEPFDHDEPDAEADGHLATVTAEHWTEEQLAELGEWSP